MSETPPFPSYSHSSVQAIFTGSASVSFFAYTSCLFNAVSETTSRLSSSDVVMLLHDNAAH